MHVDPIVIPARQLALLDLKEEIERSDAHQAGTIGYQARLCAQLALPYKDPDKPAKLLGPWMRVNGTMVMSVSPAVLDVRRNGEVITGFPFGVIPRLLVSWMTTEALAQKSRTLHLGTGSLAEFMGQLGIGRTGGNISRLRDQIKRVAGSSLTVTDTRPNLDAGEHFSYISKWRLWWTPEGEAEPPDAPKIIVLSEEFYEDLTNRGAVPVDLRVLRALRSKGGGAFPIEVSKQVRLVSGGVNLNFGLAPEHVQSARARAVPSTRTRTKTGIRVPLRISRPQITGTERSHSREWIGQTCRLQTLF